jgi:hypothetical protein
VDIFDGGITERQSINQLEDTYYKQTKVPSAPEPFEVARAALRQELADQQAETPKAKKRVKKEAK